MTTRAPLKLSDRLRTMPRLLTAEDVVQILALPSVQALRDMHSRGQAPPRQPLGHRRVRYDPIALADWIDAQHDTPTPTRKPKSPAPAASEGEEVGA